MKTFAERNLFVVGAVGLVAVVGVVITATEYDQLPIFASGRSYSAYFADAGAMRTGSKVEVSGYKVGEVTDLEVEGPRALVTFTVAKNVRLGDRTEAAIQADSVLGSKIIEVTPRGDGQLSGPIPVERTRSPYQLPEALGDLSSTVAELNTDQLSQSLDTLAQTFKDTAPDLRLAVTGLTRFSQTLNTRDQQLGSLLVNADKVSTVLAKRTDQVVDLIKDTNALLAQLRTESGALDSIAGNLSAVSRQLSGLIAENRTQLRPALDKLNGVLAIVDNRKGRVQESIKLLNAYAMSLGESVASGPFFQAYVANLIPGQLMQPFIDAAFSDLGLDPNVKLPSQLTDPQTGQPGTPPLPVPYPRTGQGGDPRMTIPDAITGNPGDQQCGPPGVPLPGPGCYPYRDPLPAPPAGGPPPGPPAPAPGLQAAPEPSSPRPVSDPLPGEAPPRQQSGGGQ